VNHYNKDRDNAALGKFYTDHVSAMTREGLHAKSDIASELAVRDAEIAELRRLLGDCRQVIAWEYSVLDADPRGRESEHAALGALVQAIDAARGGE